MGILVHFTVLAGLMEFKLSYLSTEIYSVFLVVLTAWCEPHGLTKMYLSWSTWPPTIALIQVGWAESFLCLQQWSSNGTEDRGTEK